MRRVMLFTMMSLMGLTLLAVTFFSTQNIEQNQKRIFDERAGRKIFLLGSRTEFSNSTEITQQDVQLMWQKVQMGIQIVDQFWQTKFTQNGIRYYRPQVKYFTSPVNTGCGTAEMNNAFYCGRDHTIYFDALFFAKVMKGVGNSLGTDGDMAVIFILAHEWGHAAQAMTNREFQFSINAEENADCTAGAFTRYVYDNKWLEKGDLEEVTTALNAFGDELPYGADGGHGDGLERIAKFQRGLKGGLVACGGFTR